MPLSVASPLVADGRTYAGSLLENAPHPNPTIDTLRRYADAVGKEVPITLIDKDGRLEDTT